SIKVKEPSSSSLSSSSSTGFYTEILHQLIQSASITLPPIKPYNPKGVKPTWFNSDLICAYHRTPGHDTEGCKALQAVIKSLLEESDLLLEEEQVPPVILAPSKPQPSTQTSSGSIPLDLPPSQIDTIHIATRTQRYHNPSSSSTSRPRVVISAAPEGVSPSSSAPRPKVSIRAAPRAQVPVSVEESVMKQLTQAPVKMSLFDLIQSSPQHRQALIDNLRRIAVNSDEPQPFELVVGLNGPSTAISFEDSEIPPLSSEDLEAPLFITVQINNTTLKRVMIDSGAALNVISSHTFEQLKLPKNVVSPPPFALRSFNDQLAVTLGTVVLPIRVGKKLLHELFYIVEGKFHYNMILGRSWIRAMHCVPSTLHRCLKYQYEGKIYTHPGDPFPSAQCDMTTRSAPLKENTSSPDGASSSSIPATKLPDLQNLEETLQRFSLGELPLFSFDAHLKPNEYGRPDKQPEYQTGLGRIVTIGLPNQQTNFIYGGLDTPHYRPDSPPRAKPYLTGFDYLQNPTFAKTYLYRCAWKGFGLGKYEQ
ncbi:hypothetical protein KI387_011863, partial [Taxus chinensis]